ncbi:MAG: hypothetical protein ACYDDF_02315 [Thermoplasmatota archaeon]
MTRFDRTHSPLSRWAFGIGGCVLLVVSILFLVAGSPFLAAFMGLLGAGMIAIAVGKKAPGMPTPRATLGPAPNGNVREWLAGEAPLGSNPMFWRGKDSSAPTTTQTYVRLKVAPDIPSDVVEHAIKHAVHAATHSLPNEGKVHAHGALEADHLIVKLQMECVGASLPWAGAATDEFKQVLAKRLAEKGFAATPAT